MAQYPFLANAFLQALEDSGSINADTGWEPCHIDLHKNSPDHVFMPLYVKTHSYGEYVFDWVWANAYERKGLPYYPKLLSAIPFSPATGPRLRNDNGCLSTGDPGKKILAQIKMVAEQTRASGWHLLFPDEHTRKLFVDQDLMERSGVQFHWFNRGYENFDHFLAGFVSRKRKMVRKERRSIAAQNLSTTMLRGPEISSDLWLFFYGLYQNTYLKRSGTDGYLTREFFLQIGETMAEQIAMAIAYDGDNPVACALYLFDDETLFGRYWGCIREYDHLHFELCYYQGIDFAIANGLKKFDAGAQGEHKLLRGFEPVETYSLHWIRHPGFAEAIAQFIEQEGIENARYMAQARSVLPYRNESD